MRTQREEVSSPSEGETFVGSRVVGNPEAIGATGLLGIPSGLQLLYTVRIFSI